MNRLVNIVAVADLLFALVVVGYMAGYLQAWVRGRHYRLKYLPLGLLAATVPAGTIIALVISPSTRWAISDGIATVDDGLIRQIGRVVGLMLMLGGTTTMCLAIWERVRRFGIQKTTQSALRLLPATGICILVGWFLVFLSSLVAETSSPVVNGNRLPPELPGLVLLILLAANATAIARVLVGKGLERIALASANILPTLGGAALAYLCFTVIYGGGANGHEMATSLAGYQSAHESSVLGFAFWWLVMYLAVVLTIGVGAALGLRRRTWNDHRLERANNYATSMSSDHFAMHMAELRQTQQATVAVRAPSDA